MMNQFALHVRKSSFVRINRHPWSRRWGWGRQRRDVYLATAHIYLPVPRDALKTTVYPPAQTPGQWLVLGGQRRHFQQFLSHLEPNRPICLCFGLAKQPKRLWQGPLAQAGSYSHSKGLRTPSSGELPRLLQTVLGAFSVFPKPLVPPLVTPCYNRLFCVCHPL